MEQRSKRCAPRESQGEKDFDHSLSVIARKLPTSQNDALIELSPIIELPFILDNLFGNPLTFSTMGIAKRWGINVKEAHQ